MDGPPTDTGRSELARPSARTGRWSCPTRPEGPAVERRARCIMSPMLEEAAMTGPRERWRPLHEFAYIDRAFRDVRRRLADRPGEIVPGSATAYLAGIDLTRDVHMVVGDLQIGHKTAWLTIHWEDLRHPGLFPL